MQKDIINPFSRKWLKHMVDKAMEQRESLNINDKDFESPVALGKKLGYIRAEDDGTMLGLFRLIDEAEENKCRHILFLDTETNTLNGYAVQVSAVLYDIDSRSEIAVFDSILNPLARISKETEKIHGISDQVANQYPNFGEVVDVFEKNFLMRADMICAYNALYDIGTLFREYERIGRIIPKIFFADPMPRLKNLVQAKSETGRKKDAKLEEAAAFFGFDVSGLNLHNSLEDVRLLIKVWNLSRDFFLNR